MSGGFHPHNAVGRRKRRQWRPRWSWDLVLCSSSSWTKYHGFMDQASEIISEVDYELDQSQRKASWRPLNSSSFNPWGGIYVCGITCLSGRPCFLCSLPLEHAWHLRGRYGHVTYLAIREARLLTDNIWQCSAGWPFVPTFQYEARSSVFSTCMAKGSCINIATIAGHAHAGRI